MISFIICCLIGHKIRDLDEDSLDIFKTEKIEIKCARCNENLIIYNDPEDEDRYYQEEA